MYNHTSRRALIGGVGIAAVLAVGPMIGAARAAPVNHIPAVADRAAWDAAMQVLATAKVRDAEICTRFNAAEADGTLTDPLETEWDESCGVVCNAEWALFDTPAPDVAAVEWKVFMLRDRGLAFDTAMADRLLADLRSIGGEG